MQDAQGIFGRDGKGLNDFGDRFLPRAYHLPRFTQDFVA